MAAPKGLEFTGLRELNASLKKLGVADAEIKEAMNDAGLIVANEAKRLAPSRSGKLARTIKANKNKNKLAVSVGNNTTARYGWTMHANATRYSYAKGYMTFDVPTHSRKSRKGGSHQVKAHSVIRRVRVYPFLYMAFEAKKKELYQAYVSTIDRLIRGVG